MPHELTQKNLMDRICICESLLNRNKIDPFLKRMVTDDEKWIIYDNVKRKRSWSNRGEPAQTVAKPGLTASSSDGVPPCRGEGALPPVSAGGS